MTKTNPIGVRFNKEQLEIVMLRHGLHSPQAVVNYLLAKEANRSPENESGEECEKKPYLPKGPSLSEYMRLNKEKPQS